MTQLTHLIAIEKITASLFEQRWRALLKDPLLNHEMRYPGVYLLAYSHKNLQGKNIKEDDVLYVGMSNAQDGVRSRLLQFRKGIEKYGTHSGAMRFFREYQNNIQHSKLKNRKIFFYAAISIECVSEKGRVTPRDVRALGHVTCVEMYAIARVLEKTGHPPPLNKFGRRPITASSQKTT